MKKIFTYLQLFFLVVLSLLGQQVIGQSPTNPQSIVPFINPPQSSTATNATYIAWLAVISGNGDTTPTPGSVEDQALNQLFNDLQSSTFSNLFSKHDALYAFMLNNTSLANLSKYNLIDATKYKIIPSGTANPTYGKFGWTGTSTGYLRTQYNPSTNGVNWTLNSASVYAFQLEGNSGLYTLVGAGNSGLTQRILIDTRLTGGNQDQYAYQINTGTTVISGSIKDAQGLWMANRTASNVHRYLKDGNLIANNTTASSSVLSQEIYLLADNRNGTATLNSAYTIGFAGFAAGLSAQEEKDLSTVFYRFFQKITTQDASTVVWPAVSNTNWNLLQAAQQSVANKVITSTSINQVANAFSATGYEGAVIVHGKYIYVCPTTATRFCKYDISDPSSLPIYFGPTLPALSSGSIRWAGGCLWNGRYVVFPPYDASSIVVIDTQDDSGYFVGDSGVIGSWSSGSTTLTGTVTGTLNGFGDGGHKWNGDVTAAYNNCVYMTGYGKPYELKFNPATNAITYISIPSFVDLNCVGITNGRGDNKIYHSPFNATVMPILDTTNDTFDVTTYTGFPASANKWVGINLTASGLLIFIPYSYNKVSGVDLNTGLKIPEFGSFTSGTGYYGSGARLFDDNVIGIPQSSTAGGLFIDTHNFTATNFPCNSGYTAGRVNRFGQIGMGPLSNAAATAIGYKTSFAYPEGATDNIWDNKAFFLDEELMRTIERQLTWNIN